jgi:hypothetical protein
MTYVRMIKHKWLYYALISLYIFILMHEIPIYMRIVVDKYANQITH